MTSYPVGEHTEHPLVQVHDGVVAQFVPVDHLYRTVRNVSLPIHSQKSTPGELVTFTKVRSCDQGTSVRHVLRRENHMRERSKSSAQG